jgi:hypothetical protein
MEEGRRLRGPKYEFRECQILCLTMHVANQNYSLKRGMEKDEENLSAVKNLLPPY